MKNFEFFFDLKVRVPLIIFPNKHIFKILNPVFSFLIYSVGQS